MDDHFSMRIEQSGDGFGDWKVKVKCDAGLLQKTKFVKIANIEKRQAIKISADDA
jgi:hypothetical protein